MRTSLWMLLGLLPVLPVLGALDIAQTPLYLGTRAEPNIMFTLDNSSSMLSEVMPEELVPSNLSVFFIYPRADDVYGSYDWSNSTVTFADSNDFNAYNRSSQNNRLYYNPSLTYRPWANADGSLMANASITCAPHNPTNTTAGCRDLTKNNSSSSARYYKGFSSNNYSDSNETFWPAVYFSYKGSGDLKKAGSYTRVEIKSGTTYDSRPNRSDCKSAPVCTYAEEIQNFANWYTYYRSRILAARAGVGRAFASQGNTLRVGFTTINSGSTMLRPVAPFSGTQRTGFFTDLYSGKFNGINYTPLRTSLQDVGNYFSRTDNNGPWATSAGSTAAHLTCRQSYNILMTDGYWTEGRSYNPSPAVGDVDKDGTADTLADVSLNFWKTDLRTDLANKVPTSTTDPANWQHLVNFTVGLGVNGTLNPANGVPSSWPDPYDSDAKKVDDLWHAAVNSKGGFFSAADPDTFATALSNTLAQIASRTSSASSVTANATRLDSNTHIYQARYNSGDWSGQLIAIPLDDSGALENRTWDAAAQIPSPADRRIFTLQGGSGINFTWADLNATNKALFALGGDTLGEARVGYLRGDRSREQGRGGTFRDRSSVLGDIINSDPVYVGRQDYGYGVASGMTQTERERYVAFLSSTLVTGRPPMLYVGANDGMLHGFRASDGVETMAYVPASQLGELTPLTQLGYAHRYYVDGSSKVGDAYLNGGWKTVLLGSTGAGGKAVFAIDVTNPANMMASNVMWEFNTSSNAEMGVALSVPTLGKIKAGDKWVALVANGYNSQSQMARLFVIDLADGSLIKELNTGVGSSSAPNGLSSPLPVDVDGDKLIDYVYAGDLQGNLWKFDLTANNSNQWGVALKTGNQGIPLYQACDGTCSATSRQPITVRPLALRHPNGGVMVLFGTGSYITNDDKSLPSTPRIDAVYGIWDVNGQSSTITASQLQSQAITSELAANGTTRKFNVRVVSNNAVDYSARKGWSLRLISPGLGKGLGERQVAEMLYRHKRLIFNTLIPSSDACDFGGRSWLMEIEPFSGARLSYSVFDVNGDSAINDDDYVEVPDGNGGSTKVPGSGKQFDELTTTPSVVEDGEVERKYMSGSSGNVSVTLEEGAGDQGGRQSWIQLE
ncbi:pilus assembly protein [Aeromonas encheleia]|uniref:pilus assembly protein n=1 Tax=Aeromonas encheleia TaxID=73010 RepID=UPI001F56F768|nr:PilC/PilY family type IV pilus protein [Aeromonas encheleia]UNP88034.1 pilus assembly protein [Aeromonas encheleia]